MRPDLESNRNRALILGLTALVVCGLGAFTSPDQFFRSYLLGWIFWVNVALGCLPLLMMHHLTGGAWGLVIRRMLEAGSATLPFLAILFLPVLLGLDHIYLWANAAEVARDPVLQYKSPYLNVPFFWARTAFYFAIWIGMSRTLNRWSLEQDATGDPVFARRMQLFSGPGLGVYGLTVTFASVDWIMSLAPHWFSTIFGMWFAVCQGLAAFAFVIALLVGFSDREPIAGVIRPSIYHDLGKLLLAFVMVWAYLSFSQFLIIFAGNLPEEIPFYLVRSQGGWQWLAVAIVLFHFVLPFVLLLSRDLKRSAGLLAVVAVLVLVMRYVDILWLIVPNFTQASLRVHWMDVVLPVGLGGIWLALFFTRLARVPLLPQRDPYAAEDFAAAAER